MLGRKEQGLGEGISLAILFASVEPSPPPPHPPHPPQQYRAEDSQANSVHEVKANRVPRPRDQVTSGCPGQDASGA